MCKNVLTRLAFSLACWSFAVTANAADLIVEVVGLRSNQGDVHIALYDTPETFPDPDGMREEVQVSIARKRTQFTFKNLPAGRYAVALYHDEDSDNEFDQGLFGIPLEDYAFSNNATVFFAPPAFKDAAFDVSADGTVTKIQVNPPE